VQAAAPVLVCVQVPPLFVRSQKFPLGQLLSVAQAVHTSELQKPLRQSVATTQASVFAQAAHVEARPPPQSTSVSPPSFVPSMQCIATHMPVPLQTTPPLSAQATPLAASVVVHVLVAVQTAVAQTVPVAGQSVGPLQATHLPAPSQTVPPLSVQVAPLAAFEVPQALFAHVFVTQAVVGAEQSVGMSHATQLPLPSQTLSPVPPVHAVPEGASPATQQPAVQVPVTQALVPVQSPSP
jgi:hypothetical protein